MTSGLVGSRKVPGRYPRNSGSSGGSSGGGGWGGTTGEVGGGYGDGDWDGDGGDGGQLPLTATGRRLFPKPAGGEQASDADDRATADGNTGKLPRRLRGGRELKTGPERELLKLAASGNWRVPDADTEEEGWSPDALKLSAAIWDKMSSLYKSPHDGFKGMNLNRSGGISRGELAEWCKNKHIDAPKTAVEGLFRVLDEDGNDNVDNAEFLRKIAKVLEDRRRRPATLPRYSVAPTATRHEKGIREVLDIGNRLRNKFHRRWNTIQKALQTCVVSKGYSSPFMRGKVTADELTNILKRYTGGDETLNKEAEKLVAAVEITGEGGERGVTASEFIDAFSKPVEISAVHSGYDPLSSYLQQVWWRRNPPEGAAPERRRELRVADAEKKASERFAEWVSECGGSEAAATVLMGGGDNEDYYEHHDEHDDPDDDILHHHHRGGPPNRETLRRRLQELDALGTSNERIGENGEGPGVLDAFLDANCPPVTGEDGEEAAVPVDYGAIVAKHSHPLDPAEPPLPPPQLGLVAPPRSPHALGATSPGERSRLAAIRPATTEGETGPRPATGAAHIGLSGTISDFHAAEGVNAVVAHGGNGRNLLYGGASGTNEGLLGSGRSLSSMGGGPGQGMKVTTQRPKTSAGVVCAQLYKTMTAKRRPSRLRVESSEPNLGGVGSRTEMSMSPDPWGEEDEGDSFGDDFNISSAGAPGASSLKLNNNNKVLLPYPGLKQVHSGGAMEQLPEASMSMTPFSGTRVGTAPNGHLLSPSGSQRSVSSDNGGGGRGTAGGGNASYWLPAPVAPPGAPTLYPGSLTSPSRLGSSSSATASLLSTHSRRQHNTRYSASDSSVKSSRFRYTGHMVEALPESPSFASDTERFDGGSTARRAARSVIFNASSPAASYGRTAGIRRGGVSYAHAAAENLQLEAHHGRNEAVLAAGARKKSLEKRVMRSYEKSDLRVEMKQTKRLQGMARDRIQFNKQHPEIKSLAVGEMAPPMV